MTYLFIENLGTLELLIALFILMGPIIGVFFLGYFIGKNHGRKKQ